MPPTRRRPAPATARKPKVAGLRKPTVHPEHRTEEHPAEVTQRIELAPDITETLAERAAEEQTLAESTEATQNLEVTEAPEEKGPRHRATPSPKPRPGSLAARRAARSGTATIEDTETEAETKAETEADTDTDETADELVTPFETVTEDGAEQPKRRSGRSLLLVGLAVATIVLGGAAAWFGVEAGNINGSVVAQNTALSDSATTSQIAGQLTTAINTTFSYDYQNLNKTNTEVQSLLVGDAIKQYDQLFQTVEQQAPQQKLVLTTAVVDVGVTMIQGDKASALIFANQTDTRTSTNQTSQGGAMFLVNALNQQGQWKISSINTFDN